MDDEFALRFGTQDNCIEIAASVEGDSSLPSFGDARLSILVHSNGFTGRNNLWVQREGLMAFATQLAKLDQTLAGDAKLISISPDELDLTVRAASARGHLAIFGSTGRRLQGENSSYPHAVSFGFEFEPSQLTVALRHSWLSQYVSASLVNLISPAAYG